MKEIFKDYYDSIHVDENIFEREIYHKNHYLKYSLIILSFILIFISTPLLNKSAHQFEIMAYQDHSYNPILQSKQTLDYYLLYKDVTLMDTVNIQTIKEDYLKKFNKERSAFIDSQLTYTQNQNALYGYMTTSYFSVHLQDKHLSSLRIYQLTNDQIKIMLGSQTYLGDTTLTYNEYQKYENTNHSLKVIWMPESLSSYQEKQIDYSSISDSLVFEIVYDDQSTDVLTIDIGFNTKGQMVVSKRKGKLKSLNNSQKKLETYSSLKDHKLYNSLKKLLPQSVIDELLKRGLVYKSDNYISIRNDKDNPTLRLDFDLDDNQQVVGYVLKEYGFVDQMESDEKKDPIDIIHTFQDIFFHQRQELTIAKLPSHYEGGDYVAYQDQTYIYVIQNNTSMIVRCMKLE